MGSDISSCCGGSGDKDSQLDVAALPENVNLSQRTGTGFSKYTAEQIDQFKQKFYEGIEVHLILQDRTKLACQVRLDRAHEFLILSCDKKVRAIGLKDVKAVLQTKDQLKRVETSAGITDHDTCAAIHLSASGNCIPLFFFNEFDKSMFVEVLEAVRNTKE